MSVFTESELECIVFREKVTTRKQFKKVMRKEKLSRKLANCNLVTNKYNSPSRYYCYFDLFGIGFMQGLRQGLSNNQRSELNGIKSSQN